MPVSASPRRVHVIGAGIVGVCTAWWLKREGFHVTLIEKTAPGEGASLGNAGSIGLASVPPLGMPGMAWEAPGMFLNPMHPLTVQLSHIPKVIPWFIRFAMATKRSRVESIADARAALLAHAGDALDSVLREIGHTELVESRGVIHTYESQKKLDKGMDAVEMRRKRGIRLEVKTGDELREMEPALSDNIVGGIWYPDVKDCINPQRMTKVIGESFVAAGGNLIKAEVKGFDIGPDGPRQIITDQGTIPCDIVAITAGAWSRKFARELGCDVPLESERGYHIMVTDPGTMPKTHLSSNDRFIAISPMEHGLRMSSMSEFAAIDAKPNHERAFRIIREATNIVRGLKLDVASRWVGSRPATPDSLPIIGFSPRFRNVLFGFGHGHIGLTFGAITGRILSQLAGEKKLNFDISAYRPDRDFTGGHLPPSPHHT
jgi:D-amino-acid dehydrogenase